MSLCQCSYSPRSLQPHTGVPTVLQTFWRAWKTSTVLSWAQIFMTHPLPGVFLALHHTYPASLWLHYPSPAAAGRTSGCGSPVSYDVPVSSCCAAAAGQAAASWHLHAGSEYKKKSVQLGRGGVIQLLSSATQVSLFNELLGEADETSVPPIRQLKIPDKKNCSLVWEWCKMPKHCEAVWEISREATQL